VWPERLPLTLRFGVVEFDGRDEETLAESIELTRNFKAGGLDPKKYTGFAFGWGVERTIAMRTEIGDIRLLFQNDIRFLEQF